MTRASPSGMTLLEWLAVVALAVGFGLVLATGARRAPMVDEARSLKNELEEIDRALRQAEKSGQKPSDGVWDPPEFLPLLREKFSRVRESGRDPFGNPYPPVPTGARPTVAQQTLQALAGQIDPSFWLPFVRPSPDTNGNGSAELPLPVTQSPPPEAPADASSAQTQPEVP